MDCRKIYEYSMILLIFVPLISAKCQFQEAHTCLQKVQIMFDKFKTDMLNKSYIPKPSPQARICRNVAKDSPESVCFHKSLENCSLPLRLNLQREWNILKADHDLRCNAVCHFYSLVLILLLLWTAISLHE